MARVSIWIRWCAASVLGGVFLAAGCKPPPPAPPPTTKPATTAASQPDTRPLVRKFGDVILQVYPDAPTTQPLEQSVSLSEAARIRLTDPLHFDHQGHLWITHDRGETIDDSLLAAEKSDAPFEHIVNERVLFAAWLMDGRNEPVPLVVVPETGGKFSLVSRSAGRRDIGSRDDYRWDRAKVWEDGESRRLIVPTLRGVSIFSVPMPRGTIIEAYQELAPEPAAGLIPADPQVVFDIKGLLAFVPSGEPGRAGGKGAYRFLNGRWNHLTEAFGFPETGIAHLLPFADGSVAVLRQTTQPSGLKLDIASIDPGVNTTEAELLAIARSLTDSDKRIEAAKQIDQFGPLAWVTLRRSRSLSDELRRTVETHISLALKPAFGNLVLNGEGATVVHRTRDGGALLYSPAGVKLVNGETFAPAWVVARPGFEVTLLSGPLVADLKPAKTRLENVNDLWVATTDGFGPRMFLHNAFRRMLRKDERTFTDVLGTDRRGRWLFRQPVPAGQMPAANAPTLLIDPTLPDFDGRLPGWDYENATRFGWDKDGWPAVVLGNGHKMRLIQTGWEPIDKDSAVIIDPNSIPPATRPTTKPAGRVLPTTSKLHPNASKQPARVPSSDQLKKWGPPLLIDADGTHYFGGVDTLTIFHPDGSDTTWQMPSEASGFGPPVFMMRAGDGRLYLYNQQARLLRLKPTPTGTEPFVVDKVFTKQNTKTLPDDDAPLRVWTDPAGRIVFLMNMRVVVLFPHGYIPRSIRDIMAGVEDEDGVTPVEPNGEVF